MSDSLASRFPQGVHPRSGVAGTIHRAVGPIQRVEERVQTLCGMRLKLLSLDRNVGGDKECKRCARNFFDKQLAAAGDARPKEANDV